MMRKYNEDVSKYTELKTELHDFWKLSKVKIVLKAVATAILTPAR
jgi:hypothetical protein